MRRIISICLFGLLLDCKERREQVPVTALTPTTSQQRLDSAREEIAGAKTDAEKFYALNDMAKQSLAKDLLEKSERDVVLEYFELCRKFWKMEAGRLTKWSGEAKAGQRPDFGANLVC